MPANWIILLIVFPAVAGVLTMLFTGRFVIQRSIGVTALVLNLACTIWAASTVLGSGPTVLVTQAGAWPAPFGISVVIDPLAAIMLLVSSFVVLAVYVFIISITPANLRGGFFHPLYHFLVLGVQWSFVTGDLFNLFVAFEIMLMASYGMIVIGVTVRQMRQAYKYVLLNLIGSMLLVTCCGLVYGQTGTLNFAHLTAMATAGQLPDGTVPVFALLLVVFGVKSAIFPLWFWLPDTYPTVPAAIGGLFGGLLTKVGAYVVIRLFVMVVGEQPGDVTINNLVSPLILISAGFTMFVGVLGAVSMMTMRRILSIHIISQVGYMILGVGLMTQNAVAASIFFIAHNMVVKTSLFLCAGLVRHRTGTDDLTRFGGLLRTSPWLGAVFLVAALSLAGLPPTSGFFGKLVLIQETFVTGHWLLAVLAIATSVFTLLSMLKIWSYGFWSAPTGSQERHASEPGVVPSASPAPQLAVAGGPTPVGLSATVALVSLAVFMGLGANLWFGWATQAADVLMTRDAYVEAVLYPQPGPEAPGLPVTPPTTPPEPPPETPPEPPQAPPPEAQPTAEAGLLRPELAVTVPSEVKP
ncbi:MAG: proton-conducting transporter membrane subunit [Phycisphaerae bacterium]